jgi:chemotaxis family two-component system sensor kinase Cph1
MTLPPQAPDLTSCDREPIHISGAVQPHGVLLALSLPDLTVVQASDNAGRLLGCRVEDLLGMPVTACINPADAELLRSSVAVEQISTGPIALFTTEVVGANTRCDGIAHLSDGLLVLELEPVVAAPERADPYRTVKMSLAVLQRAPDLAGFCQLVSDQVRLLTGFDRVMVYRFTHDGTGTVIAESLAGGQESYLGLRYPASDIPKQARELYLRNWLRIIPDAGYTPAPLVPARNPLTGSPLDLSHSVLRSVSPVHLEYLRNMGVQASMSISLVKERQLWGLIACHHCGPRYLSYDVRTACEFLGQMASVQIASYEHEADLQYRIHLQQAQARLLDLMADADDFDEALRRIGPHLLSLFQAQGAALSYAGELSTYGVTPDTASLHELVAWLVRARQEDVFVTDSLARVFPAAAAYAGVASGVLAVPISRSRSDMILWFRSEQVHTVTWGGDPNKPMEVGDGGEQRLSPRKSFVAWREQVHGTSEPWLPHEVEAARDLRNVVLTIVLRKNEELLRLNADLEHSNAELDSFAYIASHDLKEPLRGIHNYAGFLVEDYQDQIDEKGIEKLQTLVRLSQRMEALIESLLYYSRVGRVNLSVGAVALDAVLADTLELLQPRIVETGAEIRIPRSLPLAPCDRVRIGEVFANLISNALKYNDKPRPVIEIGYLEPEEGDASWQESVAYPVFYVRDNGIGIRQKHFETIFRIFKRLHGRNDYGGGTGAGLTITRKIVERHGGRIWVESIHREGTTFFFTLGTAAGQGGGDDDE